MALEPLSSLPCLLLFLSFHRHFLLSFLLFPQLTGCFSSPPLSPMQQPSRLFTLTHQRACTWGPASHKHATPKDQSTFFLPPDLTQFRKIQEEPFSPETCCRFSPSIFPSSSLHHFPCSSFSKIARKINCCALLPASPFSLLSLLLSPFLIYLTHGEEWKRRREDRDS